MIKCEGCGSQVPESKYCPVCGHRLSDGGGAGPSREAPDSRDEPPIIPGEKADTLRFMFDSIADGIVVIDMEGNIVDVNESIIRMGGYSSKEEVLGHSGFEFVDASSLPPLLESFEMMEEIQQNPPIEYTARGKDGEPFTGEAIASILRDESGNPTGMIAVIRDITERKRTQEKLLAAHRDLQAAHEQLQSSQEQLLQSAKMAAVGRLVSGVAHELNNPLMAISGYTELLMKEITGEPSRRYVERLYRETERTIGIVRNLLSFARKQESVKVPVSVNDSLEATIQLRSYELGLENIEIEMDLAPDLPLALADSQQLQQVFLNLLINAEYAIREAGGEGRVVIRSQVDEGKIRVAISDTGVGVLREIQGRIFEPFFTTKGVGEGTGLGLSICYGIIQDHGGEIWVESGESPGATFFVELPSMIEPAQP